MTEPSATILIVDDELHNRKLLDVLLRHEGYVVVSVGSGEDALTWCATSPNASERRRKFCV